MSFLRGRPGFFIYTSFFSCILVDRTVGFRFWYPERARALRCLHHLSIAIPTSQLSGLILILLIHTTQLGGACHCIVAIPATSSCVMIEFQELWPLGSDVEVPSLVTLNQKRFEKTMVNKKNRKRLKFHSKCFFLTAFFCCFALRLPVSKQVYCCAKQAWYLRQDLRTLTTMDN